MYYDVGPVRRAACACGDVISVESDADDSAVASAVAAHGDSTRHRAMYNGASTACYAPSETSSTAPVIEASRSDLTSRGARRSASDGCLVPGSRGEVSFDPDGYDFRLVR